ncbi:GAF domain-containing protein [Salinibacter sp. 10B]|uniref:GAF domain-containing protein n=1 Tax=Salinibacter sp. 10B TaxID=1923971 RepID=UPI0011AFD8C2|nr:GAF domain-containing protein [Salinibacter sp. 10B]
MSERWSALVLCTSIVLFQQFSSLNGMESSTYSNAPDLEDTSKRQAALRRYHILDTAPEKNFDRITSLVAKVCDVSTALITLIDDERQWFKSCFGFDARETDIGVSFCVHAVHQGEMLVVEDATKDPRFKDNPIVTGPPHIRFYAGAPLTTPEGVHIGTLCIIDYEAQPFDASQREILERLADVVVNQFELRSAEAQVRQLVNENPQPMYVYSESDGSLMYVNEAARDTYGYDKSDFASMTADTLEAPPEDQPSSADLSMHKRADGSFFPVQLREHEVLFDGQAARLAAPQSVSQRHDSDSTVFFQTDLEGNTQSLSGEWEAATGFSVSDTIGRPLTSFVHPLDRSATSEAFSALLAADTDVCQHEASFLTNQGEQKFELHARLMRDDTGSPSGVAGTLTPILDEDTAPEPESTSPASASSAEADTSDDIPVESSSAEPAPSDEAEFPPEEPSPEAASPSPAAQAEEEEEEDENEGAEAADAPAHDADDSTETSSAKNESAPAAESNANDASADSSAPDEAYDVFSPSLPTFSDEGFEDPVPTDADDGSDSVSDAESTSDPAASNALATNMEESGDAIDLTPEPFDLVTHLHAVLDRHEGDTQSVELRRTLPDTSVPVRHDPSAVETIVDALLANALTHTETGTITVKAEAGEDEVALHVIDTGSEVEERFMEVYLDEASGPEASGLHRIHQLAGHMEGTLDMKNGEHGTHFTLTLPRSSVSNGNGQSSLLPSDG